MRAAKLTGVLGTLIATLSLSGVAGVENSESSEAQNTRIPALETGTQQQKAALRNEIGGLTEVGSQLKEAQAQADAATWRTQELDQQTRSLNKNLEAQRAAAEASQAQFEDRDKATYNQDSQRALGETIRQLEQQKAEYTKSRKEQRTGTEELGRREAKLKVAVGKSGPKKVQMERRLAQLEAAEEAGAFTRPPASGGCAEMRERELEIAREDIVVRPVEPIPYERYVQIYKAAAKRT